MEFERFDLLARVLHGHGQAAIDLSSSDMPGQQLAEYGGLEDFPLAESHVGGGEPLRSRLAELYGGKPEDYIVTAGASEANFAACSALLDRGDPVLVERPTYQPLVAIPRALGGSVHDLPRTDSDGFRVTADSIRESLPARARLLILSNLHNPTGTAIEPHDVRAIAELASERDFHVLVDEMFRELAIDQDIPTMGGLNEHVIVTCGLSKFYGAGGLRIGWVRAAQSVRDRIRRVLDYLSIAPCGLSEAVALALLRERSKTMSRNRRLIEEGRKVANEWRSKHPDVHWSATPGHLAFPFLGGDTARLAERLLAHYSTFIAPGEAFGLGGHFRLNLGIGPEPLAEGLRRVARARSDG